jgi:hypothetical protein
MGGRFVPVRADGTKIVEKKTGKVIGHSKTPELAKKAARVRNAIHYSTWKPPRGPKRSV